MLQDAEVRLQFLAASMTLPVTRSSWRSATKAIRLFQRQRLVSTPIQKVTLLLMTRKRRRSPKYGPAATSFLVLQQSFLPWARDAKRRQASTNIWQRNKDEE